MSDKFFFHSKSASAVPGRGVNESVSPGSRYDELAAIQCWRKKLSNFWPAPFDLDGHRWNTVEHYFQAQKLCLPLSAERDPSRLAIYPSTQSTWPLVPFEQTVLFFKFCLDATEEQMAESEYPNGRFDVWHSTATADGSAAQKLRKMITLTPLELSLWESRKEAVMEKAQMAKFSQNADLRIALLATGTAELWHGAARQPAARMMTLERVREALREADSLEH